MYYCIKKAGECETPRKPYLIITMVGINWGSLNYAYKFKDLKQAISRMNYLKQDGHKVFIEWHNAENWGEVNPMVFNSKKI